MKNDDRKLDREKFERALARAVELSEEGDTDLSTADLIDVGRQLGIDERITRAALAEVEGATRAEVPRPADSEIQLELGADRLRLAAPAHRWAALSAAVPFGIAGLVALFFAMLTGGTVHATVLFASFWLPFLIGYAVLALKTEELLLGAHGGELVLRFGRFTHRLSLDPRRLSCRRVERTPDAPSYLAFTSGARCFRLLAGRSNAELAWVEDRLTRWLAQRA
jgi:hypothetical protein